MFFYFIFEHMILTICSKLHTLRRVTINILHSFCAAAIANPYSVYSIFRNPNEKNSGKLILLSDFLFLAKNSTSLSGVLISVEVTSPTS